MARYERFEDLPVWKESRRLTKDVYDISALGAFAKDFGLRDQMRRAAVSIMSNIAEGFEHRTNALFVDYLGRAKASTGELRAQTYVAFDVGYLEQTQFEHLLASCESCTRQLTGLIDYLNNNIKHRGNTLRDDNQIYDTPRVPND
jgi:four helix bundle protein